MCVNEKQFVESDPLVNKDFHRMISENNITMILYILYIQLVLFQTCERTNMCNI